jgi:hypothetical protein
MGLARSHVRDLLGLGDDWTDGRTHRTPHDDDALLTELRQEIVDLPTYGHRRVGAIRPARMKVPCPSRVATCVGAPMPLKSSATLAKQ